MALRALKNFEIVKPTKARMSEMMNLFATFLLIMVLVKVTPSNLLLFRSITFGGGISSLFFLILVIFTTFIKHKDEQQHLHENALQEGNPHKLSARTFIATFILLPGILGGLWLYFW